MKRVKLKEKDYKKALEVASSEKIRIKNILNGISSKIEGNLNSGKTRFRKLEEAFEKESPKGTALRQASEELIYTLMENVFTLYFIGNNSAVFIELYGFLERFSITELPKLLAVNTGAANIIEELVKRKTLPEISELFLKMSLWNEEDDKFIKKLSNIRNGIAHKNAQLITKHLGCGKKIAIGSIDEITNKADCVPFILRTIKLLVTITGVIFQRKIIDPRFEARLNIYRNVIPRIFNLFLEPDITSIKTPEIKYLVLTEIISEVILVASEKLSDLLGEYKLKVLDFHNVLNVDDKKSETLHKELTNLVGKIFEAMREDLGYDRETDILKKLKINI